MLDKVGELEVTIVQDGAWGVGVKVAGAGVGRGERAGCDHGEVQDGGWGVAVKVADVGVGQGERAGGDHGEVQDGGWGVGVKVAGVRVGRGERTMNIEELFFKLNATRLK